jgi:hypothetical protein
LEIERSSGFIFYCISFFPCLGEINYWGFVTFFWGSFLSNSSVLFLWGEPRVYLILDSTRELSGLATLTGLFSGTGWAC